jgi:pimeloyl-ACP methyl ester carboxylesterase
LVLTSCDAFEHFPPPILDPVILAAKSKTLFPLAIQAMRLRVARKRAYGGLAHGDIDHLARVWVRPALSNPAIAEDLRQLTLSCRTDVTTGVAARLPEFDKPALIAWPADDVFFGLGDGERLAATLPNARLEVVERARTFSMVDMPDRLADLISTIAVRT